MESPSAMPLTSRSGEVSGFASDAAGKVAAQRSVGNSVVEVAA